MDAVHEAIVNWIGHKYGYQNFDSNDKSRNSLFFDFLTGGVLFRNNHYKLPSRVNFIVKNGDLTTLTLSSGRSMSWTSSSCS